MQRKQSSRSLAATLLGLALVLSSAACQPAANSKANANAPPISRNLSARTNAEDANSGVQIHAREPEKYTATLQLSIETEPSDKATAAPALSVQVSRNGDDRRFEFKLPDGTALIYLDHSKRHYVIVPARKQYAELAEEQTDKIMTPEQLIEDLKGLTGVERAGEGLINGRAAEKYRYSAADKNTPGGDAKAQAFIYVDRETGLPLRAEKLPRRSAGANGVKTTRLVIEMRDIKPDIEASMFEVPAGFAQVAPDKVRPQIDALTNELGAALKAMMAGAANPTPAPAASVSPKPN